MRATLEHVLTGAAFERMIPLAKRFTDGVAAQIRAADLPWNVTQLGARAEYTFTQRPPRNGSESYAASDFELERFLHLYALNRGVLLTPFHNMALMCSASTETDIDAHTKIFTDATRALLT
jgi:glutamate-1-semialdehyde 2,1-aminomutase